MSKSEIIIENDQAVLPELGAVVTLNSGRPVAAAAGSKIPSQTPVVKNQSYTGDKIIHWGEDNLFPQNVIKDVSKSTILSSVLAWKARACYGDGIVYGKISYDDKGKPIYQVERDEEVEKFFKRSKMTRYLQQASKAYYWFKNLFPSVILHKNRKSITHLLSQRPEYCRYSEQLKDGSIKYVYLNANWDQAETADSKLTKRFPLLDPYNNPIEDLKTKKVNEAIYPVNDPSPGTQFYQVAEWNSIRKSGWLEVAESIPKFKKNLFANQLSIKYHIEVASDYWKFKYKDWDSLTTEQKAKAMGDELQAFQDIMTGNNAAGKSLMTIKFRDHMGKEYPGWTITAIDNKIKDGIYIEDSQEVSSHTFTALGVDPTLVGFFPGKGMGAGSGSDKLVAYNKYILELKPDQDIILEPVQFVAEYNGWEYDFWFRNHQLARQSQVNPSDRKTTNSNPE